MTVKNAKFAIVTVSEMEVRSGLYILFNKLLFRSELLLLCMHLDYSITQCNYYPHTAPHLRILRDSGTYDKKFAAKRNICIVRERRPIRLFTRIFTSVITELKSTISSSETDIRN